MLTGVWAFFIGIVLLQAMPALPSTQWLWSLLLLAPVWWWCRRRGLAWYRWPVAMISGFLWAAVHGAWQLAAPAVSADLHGRDLVVIGTVKDLPQRIEKGVRFQLEPELLLDGDRERAVSGRLRLSWYGPRARLPAPGGQMLLRVRLKPPRGFMNPGGFDYEAWLWQHNITGTGYVRGPLTGDEAQALRVRFGDRLQPRFDPLQGIQRLRRHIGAQLRQRFSERGDSLGILLALAIGDRSAIEHDLWQRLRHTGTSHLVAISGLHVGLVAGLAFVLGRRLWSGSAGLCRLLAAQRAAAVGAVLTALAYSALAGFAIPTQRALLMVTVAMLMLWYRRRPAPERLLSAALLGVLLLDPRAVLSWGFWLSFWAVAIILYGSTGRPVTRSGPALAAAVHFRLAVALAPFLLLGFNQVSLVSPLANLLAVPWVSLLTVPSLLSGLLLALCGGPPAWIGGGLLELSAWSVDLLDQGLILAAGSAAGEWWSHTPRAWIWPLGLLGVLIVLAPPGLPTRWLGLPALLALLLVPPPRPAAGDMSLTVLDVGQGLAAVIQTRNHVLVYDTGPRFSARFDAGSAVLVPYLRHLGYRRLDMLVVSHGDRDHAGGAAPLLAEIPAWQVLWGAGKPGGRGSQACHGPRRWQWDQVWFEVLWPDSPRRWRRTRKDNNGSCVLRIRSAHGDSVLLTGDIGRRSEQSLLRLDRDGLQSDVLLVPHHGSTTSSSTAFVKAVRPRWVVYSTGFLNRFGFPRPEVRRRYQAIGARELVTAQQGAVTLYFGAQGVRLGDASRSSRRHYWHREQHSRPLASM